MGGFSQGQVCALTSQKAEVAGGWVLVPQSEEQAPWQSNQECGEQVTSPQHAAESFQCPGISLSSKTKQEEGEMTER